MATIQRGDGVRSIAVGIFCKTPAPGLSKTRLSPPLRPGECAAISACFIRDLAATIAEVAQDGVAAGYAVYTPVGSESALRALLPPGFRLLPQCEGDFGTRLATATRQLLATHAGAIMVNADSPTLPAAILSAAVSATRRGRDRKSTSELQSQSNLVCRLLLEKKKNPLSSSAPRPRSSRSVSSSSASVSRSRSDSVESVSVPWLRCSSPTTPP